MLDPKRFALFLAAGLLLAPSAFAEGGGIGTRGGGEIARTGAGYRLRDLIPETDTLDLSDQYIPTPAPWDTLAEALPMCDWIARPYLAESVAGFRKILERIAAVSPETADAFEREFERLRFCFNPHALFRVDGGRGLERYGAVGWLYLPLALRYPDEVAFDTELFEGLPESDRPYAIFHEVAHSFIPVERAGRPFIIRRFVRGIASPEPLTARRLETLLTQLSK